jgi:hypothetical protein
MPQPPRRTPWAAIACSALLHGALLVFGWIEGRMPDVPRRDPQLIVLAPPAERPDTLDVRWQRGSGAEGRRGRPTTPGVVRRPSLPPRRPEPAPPRPALEEPEAPVDTGPAPVAPRRPPLIGRIGPGLADGRLWVRPLPLPPQELAQRLKKTHVQLVDSAVTAVVQEYLDSIASDPSARNVGLPSWTTTVAGKKFGIDSQNIYVAGLKIPAAVLALLPIPQGNIDQNRAYSHLMEMRSDLQQAARRAQNLEEFKQMIREMRLRKEREREFERNQRTAPPPEEPAVP